MIATSTAGTDTYYGCGFADATDASVTLSTSVYDDWPPAPEVQWVEELEEHPSIFVPIDSEVTARAARCPVGTRAPKAVAVRRRAREGGTGIRNFRRCAR